MPPNLDQQKSWRSLEAGESFTATYKRADLFVSEQAHGGYDFWLSIRHLRFQKER
jgi:hypothetical protein